MARITTVNETAAIVLLQYLEDVNEAKRSQGGWIRRCSSQFVKNEG